MTTYYSEHDIEITDEHIKLGDKTFQTTDVRSFDVGLTWRHFWLRWRVVPLLVSFLLFLVQGAIYEIRIIGAFLGRAWPTESIYAQDWTDYVLPCAFWSLAVSLVLLAKIKLGFKVTLNGTTGKLGSYTVEDEKLLNDSISALGKVIRIGRPQHGNPTPEAVLYRSDTAKVTQNLIILAGKEYQVSDIEDAKIRIQEVSEKSNLVIFTVLALVIIPSWVPRMFPLFTTSPTIGSNGIQVPNNWLMASAFFVLTFAWLNTMIRRLISTFFQPQLQKALYVIMVWGRIGQQNREVILSAEVYRSPDKEEVEHIVGAIQYAVASSRTPSPVLGQGIGWQQANHSVRRVKVNR